MSLFEKDVLDIHYLDLLEILVSKKTKYRLEEVLAEPCKSKLLRNIKAVKIEDNDCRFSVEFGVRVALAAVSWIAAVYPERSDDLKKVVAILLDILSEHG